MRTAFSRRKFLQQEEKHKEDVYECIERFCQEAAEDVAEKDKEVKRGAYEDQDKFVPYRERGAAWKKFHAAEKDRNELYFSPYFAHVEVTEQNENDQEQLQFFLSDGEKLDRVIPIGEGEYLIPFKRSKEHPMWEKMFHCYHAKSGETFYLEQKNGNVVSYTPSQICKDEIENRNLKSANLLYPQLEFNYLLDADELLEQKLEGNRSNPTLCNIIATLQEEQFRIISVDPDTSFVVQGCAGSGKSQCLLHRLFYLRDELSDAGWQHVLLLIPTKLFKTFSMDLMRRYQIDKVTSLSTAEFYCRLLNFYDTRFQNRQYAIEFSEEYLSDEYLRLAYSDEMVHEISDKVEQAILAQIQAVTAALGKEMPERMTSESVPALIQELNAAIYELDKMDAILKQDEQYIEKQEEYQKLLDEIEALQKKQAKQEKVKKQLQADEETLSIYLDRERQAQEARQEWIEQRERKSRDAEDRLCRQIEKMNGPELEESDPAEYARCLFYAQDLMEGQTYAADEAYLSYLNAACSEAEDARNKFTKGKTAEKFREQNAKKAVLMERMLEQLSEKRKELLEKAAREEAWLRQRRNDLVGMEASLKTLSREELRRARNSLTHMESTIFEKQVWNTLLPIKERYQVPIESKDIQRKKKRILYKSDLLYYLKIYISLHSDVKLPEYRVICIDEGQDLQESDYKLLRQLYPQAALNIFGDKGQILHDGCGVTDWERDTGIDQVYVMQRNYRNPAAIVDFCNKNFNSGMKYLGKVKKEQKPILVTDSNILKEALKKTETVTIVKDRAAFLKFCNAAGKTETDFEYMDTDAERPSGEKPACYSIFAAKGLEFASVIVFSDGMNQNQKMVSCTRATETLYYYGT